jgi:DMSO reductase family type II enzyme chaperone
MSVATLSPTAEANFPPLARLDLYRFFAACFGQPSPERFAWLSGRKVRALLKELAAELEAERSAPRARAFPNPSAYEAAYLALFEVGVPEPPVPLLESAHSHRAVPQEIVLECVNFYEVLGLRPSGSAFPPDHLVTQLEFLAAARYLRESKKNDDEVAALRRLEADFLERHLLSWLPAALKKLCALNPPLFPRLLGLLYAHARLQLASIAPRKQCV